MIITVTLNPALDKTIYLENYHHGEVNIIEKTILDPGGKGINVSKVLNNFTHPYISLGFTGGMNGKILEEHLSDTGIQYKFTPVKANTRINIKMIESSTGKTTDLNEQGDKISPRLRDKLSCGSSGYFLNCLLRPVRFHLIQSLLHR